MALRTSAAALLGAVVLLGGCSFATDSLWPSLTGAEPSRPAAEKIEIAASETEQAAPTLTPTPPPPVLGTTSFEPPAATQFAATGTFVGQKVGVHAGELDTLRRQISVRNGQLQQIRDATTENSRRYHGTVAAINARLQLGTTPGNPVLITQWNDAQGELDRLGTDIALMNSLANQVASDSSLAAFILESVRATYGLAGAIDEDHRQLAILEDETNRTAVLIDRLLNELSEDVSRQTAYVGNERRNLTTLSLAIKNGELFGTSLANRAYASAAPLASVAPSTTTRSFAAANRRPLVVIRFDRADVPYEQALYSAVARALEARPQAGFDLVAVAASQGTAADAALNASKVRKNAEAVMRSLIEMGLPANRVILSSTTSPAAATNEVHVYVR